MYNVLMQNKKIVIQNCLINYVDEGNSLQTLLFLHGWRSNLTVWEEIFKDLKDRFRCVALDLPGFGLSQEPQEPFNTKKYSQIVLEFIDKLELNNVIPVGHSFGGRILIAIGITKPEKFNKIILVNPSGVKLSDQNVFRDLIVKIARPVFKMSFLKPLRSLIYKKMGWEDYIANSGSQFYKATYKNILKDTYNSDLFKIKSHVLIFSSENDTDAPLAMAEFINREVKDSVLKIIPGAGHYSFLKNPKMFKRELLMFVEN